MVCNTPMEMIALRLNMLLNSCGLDFVANSSVFAVFVVYVVQTVLPFEEDLQM